MKEAILKGYHGIKRPFRYLNTFIGDAGVAAIHPSSRFLVARVAKAVEQSRPRLVVEFGAAEGVMTRRLLKALPHDGRLVAVERNRDFYDKLAQIRDDRLVAVSGDAREVRKILKDLGVTAADCFVSGIPFSFLSPEERTALLREIHSLLPAGGRFVAYQCTTHLIPLLRRRFARLKTELELRNMPPHFVFTAIK